MRKEKTVTITTDDRDKGKSYFLKEKPARAIEKWAARALVALANSGVDIDSAGGASSGMAGVVAVGMHKVLNLKFDEMEPLLDEMMECVQALPDSKVPRPLVEDDIEEVSTLLKLRMEIMLLHADFLPAGAKTALTSAMTSMGSSNTPAQ